MKEEKILFCLCGEYMPFPSARLYEEVGEDAAWKLDVEIDSAGITGYHEGDRADQRMRAHASRRGYSLDSISRPVPYD